MLTEQWLHDIVDRFWSSAGEMEPFPRNLEEPILWALPLAILKFPRLWLRDVENWLTQRNIPFNFQCGDRPLRACLIAHSGKGFVLIDGTDPEEERRVSLAHEMAHFVVDYLHPRETAIARLGQRIVEVLDGHRPPSVNERVSAILADAPIGVHTHLMDRTPSGQYSEGRILAAESRAERLALEVLAPAEEVKRRVAQINIPPSSVERVTRIAQLLVGVFGLPDGVARPYATRLTRAWYGEPSVRDWLGIK